MGQKRQRDVPDDADEKWDYAQHTAAKHEILQRYLGAWLAILGQGRRGYRHARLVLIDGFAGRGRYKEGSPGSPAIMFERARQVAEDGRVEEVWIRCSEPNEVNFQHLKDVCDGLTHERVLIRPTQETFKEIADGYLGWVRRQSPPPPTFVMVDPYGVTGVELETLKQLMEIDRLEVLVTFMVRDPARFITEDNYEKPLTALYGGDTWKVCEAQKGADRAECLMREFVRVVKPDIAKHATPFTVYEDERKTILYYLIHLTNSDLGMREMKEAMVKKSGEMTFYPITLRPTDQIEFDTEEQRPYLSLQTYLRQRYAGRTLSFEELLNDDYPEGHSWVEGHYRWAIKGLEQDPQATVAISRVNPTTRTGRPSKALTYSDRIAFSEIPPLT